MELDEITYMRRAVKIYRNALSNIHDRVKEPKGVIASDVLGFVVKAQHELDALKVKAPATIDPEAARARSNMKGLEEYAAGQPR